MRSRAFVAILLGVLSTDGAIAAEISEQAGSANNPHIITVQGRLEEGDEKKFIRAALPSDHALVRFDSEGGNLLAGIEIGKAIRLKQFDTWVAKDTYCASACALAWLAGRKRYMEANSWIGFHSASDISTGKPVVSGPANALVGSYLNQLGLGAEAIFFISAASPESIQWLTAVDANRYGIDVEVIEQSTVILQPVSRQPLPEARWVVKEGIDLFGFDLRFTPINVGSATECGSRCRDERGCRAYTFNMGNSACFLKSGAETVHRNVNAISGYEATLEQALRQSPFIIQEGTDYQGSDLQFLHPLSFEQCALECEKHADCRAFSYISRKGQCWLKSNAHSATSKKGITSGVRELSAVSDEDISSSASDDGRKQIYDRIPPGD
jgi:hypothetical protein